MSDNENEQLRQEIARLKGENEQLKYEMVSMKESLGQLGLSGKENESPKSANYFDQHRSRSATESVDFFKRGIARRDPNLRSEEVVVQMGAGHSDNSNVSTANTLRDGNINDEDLADRRAKGRNFHNVNRQSEQDTLRPSSRVLQEPGGKSSISLGTDQVSGSLDSEPAHKSSHFIKRRDPNATIDHDSFRPSNRYIELTCRILQEPGGKSTFQLG
jgi:hypothetical protein